MFSLGPVLFGLQCLSGFKLLLFGRRHQYLRIDCSEVSSILERPSHHQPRQQSPRQQSSSSSNTEKRLDKLIVELKVELGDGTDDIFCLFFGSRDGVSSKPRCRFLHPGDVRIFLFCLFLGSEYEVSSKPRSRFFLHVCDGVKGIFLGVYNGDEVGETDSHGEDGWGFLSLCCSLGLLSGSGDGVMLISRGLFLKATDSTNGDGVCWENADDCDVQGEGGWGSIVCSCRFEGIGVDFFFW